MYIIYTTICAVSETKLQFWEENSLDKAESTFDSKSLLQYEVNISKIEHVQLQTLVREHKSIVCVCACVRVCTCIY